MKGQYTKKFLKADGINIALIYLYMDKVLTSKKDVNFDRYQSWFNKEGEFVYVVSHTPKSEFEEYHEVTMLVNDTGIYVDGVKHDQLTKRYLENLEMFKNSIYTKNEVGLN